MANRMPAIEIEGDAELIALIQSLPERVLTEVGKSMRAAAKPIISSARGNLRKGHGLLTGLLKKSLGIRKLIANRKEMRVYMYLGPRGPKQGFVGIKDDGESYHIPLYIAHLVEFGHRTRTKGPNGTQFVDGKPFLRPAVDANRGNFQTEMKAALRRALEKKAAKAKGGAA